MSTFPFLSRSRALALLILTSLLASPTQLHAQTAAVDVQQFSIRGGGLSALGATVAIDDCTSASWCVLAAFDSAATPSAPQRVEQQHLSAS